MPCRGYSVAILAAGATLLATLSPPDCAAQTRRALLVGINVYAEADSSIVASLARGPVTDLEGAVNDVLAVGAVLRDRYHFKGEDIRVVTDSAATRTGILAAIDELTADADSGDVVVFYYAGHGSQRVNSKAPPTYRDQTIVPADANTGVDDIRNKELGRAFGKLLDKGVALTLIFDSCHSGAITRGIIGAHTKERWAPLDPRDAADPPDFTPPERRGALVLSAAQDYETAAEDSESGEPHGVFTSALLTVMRTVRTDEPAGRVFQRVRAAMQSHGRMQEPVLAAPRARSMMGLFGKGIGVHDQTTVALLRVDHRGTVELQGGTAIGLARNSELRQLDTRAGDSPVRLRVTEVHGLTRSSAAIVSGRPESLTKGDLFEVAAWARPEGPMLRVWLPGAGGPGAARTVARLSELRKSRAVEWLDDPSMAPSDSTPTFTVLWEGSEWKLQPPLGETVRLTAAPGAAGVLEAIDSWRRSPLGRMAFPDTAAGASRPARLFLSVPPTPRLSEALRFGPGSANSAIEVTRVRSDAHYLLVGRSSDGATEYAWMRPGSTAEAERDSPFPASTDWVRVPAMGRKAAFDSTARRLEQQALRLGRIRAWLTLESPPDAGDFPYHLVFRNTKTGEEKTGGLAYDGEQYRIVLRADTARLADPSTLKPRRVYIFAIDSLGQSTVLFPFEQAQNRVPFEEGKWPAEIVLGDPFRIQAPFGVDTYLFLTSEQPVPNDALEWTGVRTRGDAESRQGLAGLLQTLGSSTRRPQPVTPTDWSIERLSIRSAPASESSAK